MSTANWPTTVPPPLAQHTLSRGNVALRMMTDGGTARQWTRGSSPSQKAYLTWLLTAAEWDDFAHWINYDAGYGNNWFSADWLDTLTGGGYLGRLTGPPTWRRAGLTYEVSLTIEIQTLALAVAPVASDWPLSTNPADYVYDTSLMVFHWSAISETTPDGSGVEYMNSVDSLGSYLERASGNSYMGVDGGKRGIRIDQTQGQIRSASPSRSGYHLEMIDAPIRNFTVAFVCTPLDTDYGIQVAPNVSKNLIHLRSADFLLTDFGGVDQDVAYTLRTSGRACCIVSMQQVGSAKAYIDGNLVVNTASSCDMPAGVKFRILGYSLTSPFYNPLHEILIWHRALDTDEVADVNAKLMTDWEV